MNKSTNSVKGTQTVTGKPAPMSITNTLRQRLADCPSVIASGDDAAVKRERANIANLSELISDWKKVFDNRLSIAQSGFNGEDFLKDIKPFVKRDGRGRKATEVVINPEEFV